MWFFYVLFPLHSPFCLKIAFSVGSDNSGVITRFYYFLGGNPFLVPLKIYQPLF